MAIAYDKMNEDRRRIKTINSKSITYVADRLNYESNCIITGGKDLTFTNGAKVPNRKIILEAIIRSMIKKVKRPIIVFYKSPFLRIRIIEWLKSANNSRDCNFIGNLLNGRGKCLAPFQGMSREEIIYTVRSMATLTSLTFDQYAETFLEYLLNMIEHTGHKMEFCNIMKLVSLSDEQLTQLAMKLGLVAESKYFSKPNNGSEVVKRVLKDMLNYFQDYYDETSALKINICSEVLNNHILFIEVGDQYHTEMLEYFCNELKCCAKMSPYIIMDDIMLKNNPNFEDFLLGSTGIRFVLGAVDVATLVSKDNLEDFITQASTKFFLHYENANAAETVTSSIGAYYHMRVSEEKSKNRETFHILTDNVSEGTSVTEEKRLIVEGTRLVELSESQFYLTDTAYDRFFFNNVIFE